MNLKRKSIFGIYIIICISLYLSFTGCTRIVYTDSDIFTKEDVKTAYDAFCNYFNEKHNKNDGYKLKKVWYPGDEITSIESKNYSYLGYDEIIVFYTNNLLGAELSDFGNAAKDKNFKWTYILGRNQNGNWEYITGGYFRVPNN